MSAALRLTVTGSATVSPMSRSQTRSRNVNSSWSKVRTRPVSSTSVSCSPDGSITAPTSAPEAFTSSPTPAACSARSNPSTPLVEANGLTASTSAPSFDSTFGITKLVAP